VAKYANQDCSESVSPSKNRHNRVALERQSVDLSANDSSASSSSARRATAVNSALIAVRGDVKAV
jgi:hypothetical protein